MIFPGFFSQDFSIRTDVLSGKVPNFAVKSLVGKNQAEGNPSGFDYFIPAVHAGLNLGDVVIAQAFVQCGERRNLASDDAVRGNFEYGIFGVGQDVVVVEFRFVVAAF